MRQRISAWRCLTLFATLVSPTAYANIAGGDSSLGVGALSLEAVLNEEVIAQLRDPFALPSSGGAVGEMKRAELTLFPINDLKLNGVITGPNKLRAMVSAPNGKTFFVKVGDLMGMRNGRITQIRNDAITVVETEDVKGKRMGNTLELRIGGELISVSSKRDKGDSER
jgi:hypothetical protein